MFQKDSITDMARKNKGIITTGMITASNFKRATLKYMAEKGMLVKVQRGLYALPDAFEDEFVNLQTRYGRGIFSLETALFLHNLTDKTPAAYTMSFPASYNLTSPKKTGILCKSLKEPLYSMGIVSVITPAGNEVRAYNAERTLCDILRTVSRADVQTVSSAFRQYVAGSVKNIPLLSQYAEMLKVEKKLRSYLEVLL